MRRGGLVTLEIKPACGWNDKSSGIAAGIMSSPSSSEEKQGDEDLVKLHLGLYW